MYTIRRFIESSLQQHECSIDSLGLDYFIHSWNELYGSTQFKLLQDSIEILAYEFDQCGEFKNEFKLTDIEELVHIIREEFPPRDDTKFIHLDAEIYSRTTQAVL
jgi:hypothetical protein